jgi:hypothetical protein
MVAQLRREPGGDAITVTVGDFATATVDETFDVVYLVRSTITNLTTQEEQVACFRNVAAHLSADGCFVIECYVPELRRLPPGEVFHPFTVTPRHVGIDEYDVVNQIDVSHHWFVDGQGRTEAFSSPHRYVWPAELDLMARLAGMSLRERWSDWRRAPFTADSRSHVSVWQKDESTRR